MWLIILTLIIIGLILMIVELVFVPGTTVVGVLGFIFCLFGVIVCYRHFGSTTGFYVLITTSAISLLAFIVSFRSNAWQRFSLKSTVEGKFNEGVFDQLSVGTEGIALTTLRPIGKANIQDQMIEVKTEGNYVDQGTRIRIAKILSNQVIVEPIN